MSISAKEGNGITQWCKSLIQGFICVTEKFASVIVHKESF